MAVEGHGEIIGEVSMEVTADTSHFPADAEKGVSKATRDIDKELAKSGDEWGKTLADNMGTRLKKEVPKVGKDFANALNKEHVTAHVKVNADTEVDRDSVKRGIRSVIREVEDELASESTGLFQKFGQGFQDAIGSVFNVSGKSPLIIALIPVFGALAGLIGAALQAVSALGALLSTLPAIITGVGLAALGLYAAFRGVGTAIQGAFAAKNAKELKDAIKDLTPGAQEFVRNLLPLRDVFNDISKVSQQEFFRHAAPAVKSITDALKSAGPYIEELAGTVGIIVDKLGGLFDSPEFKYFLSFVANDTSDWLSAFGDALVYVVKGFKDIATAAEPFLKNFGVQFNSFLTSFGDFLTQLSTDPSTKKFFDDMQYTIAAIFHLLGAASSFVMTFLQQLDNAGGTRLIEAIANVFDQWTFILQGKPGEEILKGLINLLVLSIYLFGGLVSAILIFIGDVQIAIDAIGWLGKRIGDFFGWVGDKWNEFWDVFGKGLSGVQDRIYGTFAGIKDSIGTFVDNAIATIKSLPHRAVEAIGNIGNALYHAGASLLQGFIDGFKSEFGALRNVAGSAIRMVAGFFPGSPAKEGPLSGQGYSLLRGQRMMQDFAKGITMGTPLVATASNTAVSSVNFGPGSVNANFYGSNPTPEQAFTLGTGVGAGIGGTLAARDARAAIRSM